MTTHRNHYVPQWYQKRFVNDAKQRLFYLDLAPQRTLLPDGREVGPPALQRNSPKFCFWGQDLYTTVFGGVENDEVERFLFGAIDNDGANAIRAVAEGDLHKIHDLFQRFFEYLDAQKLRTPKGLDWIRGHYPKLDQLNLMLEMQHLRQMHCTMWMEAVREIVSAEDSEIKFIITDHPVTIYHPDCPPDSPQCAYPSDPDISLKGSQTLFPLGKDHCLILTNLEYAKDPSGGDLLQERENARHFGTTISRIDKWIRTRKLDAQQVVSINQILKSRAHRFIAATEESWLYPERSASRVWKEHGKILLPPDDELWNFGGEIYVGYEGGKSDYQDAFGRTSKAHEYLRKDPPQSEPKPEDRCVCGSGQSYGLCCLDLAPADRPPSNVFSIRERNLMFMRAIEDILGLDKGKSWEDVRRELSDEQVARIHTAYASLWPRDTNLSDLLPRPDGRRFRALYIGLIDPRTIAASVIGWIPYFDEIIILNPFVNGGFVRPEYSPIESPAQYKEQTLKNVVLFQSLISFVHAGIVLVIPDLLELNDTFREMAWSSAKERATGRNQLPPEDLVVAREFGKDDLRRLIGRLPDDALKRQIRNNSPSIAEDKLQETVAFIREEHIRDPLALIQPLPTGKDNGQLQQLRGINFELALFLAQLTGAALYTDQRTTANDLTGASMSASDKEPGGEEQGLKLRIFVDKAPIVTLARRDAQDFVAFRSALRRVWKASVDEHRQQTTELREALLAVETAARMLMAEAADVQPQDGISEIFEIDAKLEVPLQGYSLRAAQRFVLAFGRRKHIATVPVALLFSRAIALAGGAGDQIGNE